MELRGWGQIDPPPSISWFSGTPAEIGLNDYQFNAGIELDLGIRNI